jgi:hypothetical protein
MAGDWIKFEHATPDKPEVHRIADLLGVNADEAVGIVARFWIWLDKNSCNGSVTHVYAKPLESMMRCPGFVAAMVDVGWVELDEKTGRITIPNHERHNGSPAKSRALTRDRVKRTRNDHVTPTALPEKRREEKRTTESKARASRARAIPLPADFAISERVKTWAEDKGYRDLGPYLECFVGRFRANGKTYIDWDETFMNAIREDWYGIREGKNGHQGSGKESRIAEQERVMASLTGHKPGRIIDSGG